MSLASAHIVRWTRQQCFDALLEQIFRWRVIFCRFVFLDSLILQFFFFTWLEVLEFLIPGVAACGPSMLLLWKEIIEKGNYNKQSKPGKIWCGASCGSIHTSQPSSKRFSLSHGQVIFNKGKFSFPTEKNKIMQLKRCDYEVGSWFQRQYLARKHCHSL